MAAATRVSAAPSARSSSRRGALGALYAGLALTVIAAVAPVVDQGSGDVLGRHLREMYAGYPGQADAQGRVLTWLLCVGGLGVVSWLVTIWAVGRRKRWAPLLATLLFAAGTALAGFDLLVEEYGHRLLPTSFGLLGLLPSVAGVIAVVLLWASQRRTAAGNG